MPTQADITNAGNVIWGVAEKLDGLQSPFAQQLRDAWQVLKAATHETPVLPEWFTSPTNNYGATRLKTVGIVWHSTRGGAVTPALEFAATLRWFANPNSLVSAHFVIGHDRRAKVVDVDSIAWHARAYNLEWIGVELVQANPGDPITDMQYAMARDLVAELTARYGPLLHVEHKDIDPAKSDVGPPFDLARITG